MCDDQLLDVRDEDVLCGGLYRLCDVYRGGGGYDKFQNIFLSRYGYSVNQKQFVVQLKGCPMNCPYCYVTPEGVNGSPVFVNTEHLINEYEKSGVEVFHLMGGAPAIYLPWWVELSAYVKVFHSDFILVEREYTNLCFEKLDGLFAVSLKERYLYNENQLILLWKNLECLVKNKVDFYFSFTGKDEFSEEIKIRFGSEILKDNFVIPIIQYRTHEANKKTKRKIEQAVDTLERIRR